MNCLSAGAQEHWRLDGPDGTEQIKVQGNVRTNSAEFVREALVAGLGIGLRPTWDVGAQLASGELKVVLPQYRGTSNLGIYAVYPCRDYMPEKVTVFIDFLASLFTAEPWSKDQGGKDQSSAADKAIAKAAAAAARPPRRPAAAEATR